jgi:hypothetical protein
MTTTPQQHLALQHSDDVFYVESSLPPGMSMSDYRRSRPRRPTRWERLKQLAGGPSVAAVGTA